MADTVQYYLEQMVPELEDLEQKGIFSKAEIKSIVKKRTKFEYALKRRISKKVDYLRYAEYEMNLEALRKKRKVRLDIKSNKTSLSDYAGVRRIYFIFERVLRKFKGDVALWLQYIEFAKGNGASRTLGKIFASAIQMHPTKPSLWIMAASWEFEENANIVAARVLMQRGLRLNSTSTSLWHEYFRLELVYVEKIKARRKILGIDQRSQSTLEELEAGQTDANDDNMIMLPKITGEEFVDEADETGEKGAVRKMEESMVEALKENNNPVLEGLLGRIVYRNAIVAIPNNLPFRKKFIDIYADFSDTEMGEQEIYESIRRDFPQNTEARSYLAARHLSRANEVDVENPEFVKGLRSCVEEFGRCVEELPTSEMWEHYTRFLEQWRRKVTDENLKLYLTKSLTKAYKTAQKKDFLSPASYLTWAGMLLDESDRTQAQSIAKQGTQKYPASVELWSTRIDLAIPAMGEVEQQQPLYVEALRNNPASLKLWTIYLDWLVLQWQESVLEDKDLEEAFTDAMTKTTTLLPSTDPDADINKLKDLVMMRYVEWAARSGGIKKARAVYKQIVSGSFPNPKFYEACVRLEQAQSERGTAGQLLSKIAQERVEWLFEMAVRVDERRDDTYISYISHLLSQRQFQKATEIYWKATKSVTDRDAFELRYRELVEGGMEDGKVKNAVLGEAGSASEDQETRDEEENIEMDD